MAKKLLKVNPVLGTDECGKPDIFTIPFIGLFFESKLTTCIDELRVESNFQKIITNAESEDLIVEQLLFTDDDKMDIVKRLKRTGKWLK